MNEQTNIYNVAEALPVLNNTEQLPKRRSEESIWESIPWYMEVAEQKNASIWVIYCTIQSWKLGRSEVNSLIKVPVETN